VNFVKPSNATILEAIREFSRAQADRFEVETRRFMIMVDKLAEFRTAAADAKADMAVLLKKQEALGTTMETSVSALGKAVAEGHASLLDEMTAAASEFKSGIAAATAANEAIEAKLKTLLATVPTAPGVTPTTPQPPAAT
jgi:seryl-tRNA synthetase